MSDQKAQRIKVLFLASWFPNKEDNYSGIFIKRHAQAVSKYCDVAVLYFHFTENHIPQEIEIKIEDGIKVVRIYLGGIIRTSSISKIFTFLFLKNGFYFSLKGIKSVFKELGTPDIVHVNVIFPSGILALIIKYLYGIPYVLTEHTNPFKIFLTTPFKRFFSKLILMNAKQIMPVSKYLQDSMVSFYKTDKYLIVPNVVNTDLFTPYGEIRKLSEKKIILHVSRLNDQLKNISGILGAVAQLSIERDDFILFIIGEGIDKESLELKAKRLKINGSFVQFLGNKTDKDLACYMRSSQFFILNSREETFCVVCIEALSSGIPIIATRCGAPEEYITDDMGVLIPIDDSIALVNSINYMLDNWMKFDADGLHKKIFSKFSNPVVGKKIFSLYHNVIDRR